MLTLLLQGIIIFELLKGLVESDFIILTIYKAKRK